MLPYRENLVKPKLHLSFSLRKSELQLGLVNSEPMRLSHYLKNVLLKKLLCVFGGRKSLNSTV